MSEQEQEQAQPQAEPGTAVAKAKSVTEIALTEGSPETQRLALMARERLAQAKVLQESAATIAQLSWGQQLSDHARFAMARWCAAAGIDPVRHIDVLGGRIYDNANLYIDKLAATPEFLYDEVVILAPLDHRKIDPALVGGEESAARLRAQQQAINAHRLALQMEYEIPSDINNFPDNAAAALVRLYFRDGSMVEGVNWAGSRGRTKGKHESTFDPVGDIEPVKTAITRAFRKAAKKKVPVWFKRGEFGELFERAEGLIAEGREMLKAAGVDPDEGDPVAPAGSRAFQRAMVEGTKSMRKKGQIRTVGEPVDFYDPASPPAEEPSIQGQPTVKHVAPADATPFKCDRCFQEVAGPPALVQPDPKSGKAAKYCSPCGTVLLADEEEDGA